jgi:hypothetical protein
MSTIHPATTYFANPIRLNFVKGTVVSLGLSCRPILLFYSLNPPAAYAVPIHVRFWG